MPLPKIAIIRNAESEKISLPRYGNPVGTSMTLLSAHTDSIKIAPNHYEVIGTGLAIALPIGLEAQVRSLKESTQSGVYVLNAPLTIDAFDRQEIKVCLYNASSESVIIKYNDPIALLVFSPVLRVEWDDMTEKRQTQAAKTEAFMQRMNETQEPQTFVCDEFEPIEEEMASEPSTLPETPASETLQEQKNPDNTSDSYIEEQKTPIEPPAVVKEFEEMDSYIEEQKNPDNTSDSYIEEQKTPIEPPAIVKEFEEMEKNFYDTQEEKSNEN